MLAYAVYVVRERLWLHVIGYDVVWTDEDVTPVDVNRQGVAAVYWDESGRFGDRPTRRTAGAWTSPIRRVIAISPNAERGSNVAQAINSEGDIIGYELDQNLRAEGSMTLWRPSAGVKRISDPAGRPLLPYALNDRREVVGAAVVDETNPFTAVHAFLWTEDNGFVNLHRKLESRWSAANAINNRGWIVGWRARDDATLRPFLWREGRVLELLTGEVGRTNAVAVDLNDRGTVLINQVGQFGGEPFVWSPKGGLQRLPRPIESERAIVLAVDQTDRILLVTQSLGRESYYLYSRGEFVRLPDVSGKGKSTYRNLGPRGWLAGSAYLNGPNGTEIRRGFLLHFVRLHGWSDSTPSGTAD